MAMLGLMELMASQNATVDQMLEAARYANALVSTQTVEQAIFFGAPPVKTTRMSMLVCSLARNTPQDRRFRRCTNT
jgi:hypothetical protein